MESLLCLYSDGIANGGMPKPFTKVYGAWARGAHAARAGAIGAPQGFLSVSSWSPHMVSPAGRLRRVRTYYMAIHGSKGTCTEREGMRWKLYCLSDPALGLTQSLLHSISQSIQKAHPGSTGDDTDPIS